MTPLQMQSGLAGPTGSLRAGQTGKMLQGGGYAPPGLGKIPKGYEAVSQQMFTPEQMQLFSSLFGQVGPGSQLSRLASGDVSQFGQLEAPAMRQFGEMMGQLGSRFSGMGMGGRRSSGFNLATSSAAQQLAESLQSQRLGLQRQAIGDLMSMSQQLLGQRPYETTYLEKPMSFGQSFLSGLAPGIGAGIGGAMFGGPAGMAGSLLGQLLGIK